MAERSWFLDIVQECVNYEMKVQQLAEALKKCQEAHNTQAETIKEQARKLAEALKKEDKEEK